MLKLVERALVKDLLQLPRADILQDSILNTLIEQASAEAVKITRRKFEKTARTEYHTSYDQEAIDPEPQFLLLDAYPIDPAAALTVEWSPYDHRDNLSVTLNKDTGDYTVDEENGKITVRQMGTAASNLPFIGGILFTYAPRGFKVTYTGGFTTTAAPDPYDNPDPLDDYGVTQVPDGLKLIVAKKVAADYRLLRSPDPTFGGKILNPAETAYNTFRQDLRPWTKKDMI